MLVCVLRDYKGRKVLCVHKLCVRAQYRHHGLSRKLLARAYDMQKSVGADDLALAVPEHLADPTNPFNCLEWAKKMGFRAQGVLPE
jgi:GNAT superfamily N-acetyltransferase